LEGSNVHAGHVSAANQLLALYLAESGLGQIIKPTGDGARSQLWTIADAQAQALRDKSELFVLGSIIRVGTRVKIALQLYETATANRIYGDSLNAGAPEDVDPVMKRLARSLATRKAGAKAPDLDEVTMHEEAIYRKRIATHYFGLSVGATAGFGGPLKEDPIVSGFGTYWLYDNRNMLLDVTAAFGFGDSIPVTFGLDLGVHYPFTRADITPYVGAGAGFTVATVKTGQNEYGEDNVETGRGLDVWAGLGYLVGRQSTVHFKADLKYVVNLFKLSGAITHGLRFSVGIGF
jgi:hypothetical protein